MRRRWGAVAAAALGALLAAGCAGPGSSVIGEAPGCSVGDEGHAHRGVVLMAQSVPTATWIPCVEGVPLGWRFAGLDARDGSSRFWLDSDRDGQRAIEVQLSARCDTGSATEIPSARDGMRRLERVIQVTPNYLGRRYYVFDGGCVTVVFDLAGDTPAEALALVTEDIGAISRRALADQVREEHGGRLELDPPGSAR